MAQRVLKHMLQKRLYSAAAPKKTVQPLPVGEVQISSAPNGMRVVSQENNSPITRVSCCVKAGARYEDVSQRGVTHCLRVNSDITQREARAFGLTRDLQQIGASISCTQTRDNLIYTLEVTRDNLARALPYLAGMVSQSSFRPWEINDNMARMELDVLALSEEPDKRVVEALHQAAYREQGLGRSLYAPFYQFGQMSPDLLQEFVNKHFTPDRITLSGVGVDHKELVSACGKFDIHHVSRGEDASPAKYFGGEIREHSEDLIAYSALVSEGVGVGSKDVWAFAVLEQLLGAGPQIKWASNQASSKLGKAVGARTQLPFNVQAFNVNYSDSGLFGVSAVTVPENSADVLKTVVEQVQGVARSPASGEDLSGAKSRVRSTVAFQAECWSDLVEARAVELQNTGSVADLQSTLASIESVTAADVQNAAKKVMEGKMTMASVGELSNTPYMDELVKA